MSNQMVECCGCGKLHKKINKNNFVIDGIGHLMKMYKLTVSLSFKIYNEYEKNGKVGDFCQECRKNILFNVWLPQMKKLK